jgi:hypothetical protein
MTKTLKSSFVKHELKWFKAVRKTYCVQRDHDKNGHQQTTEAEEATKQTHGSFLHQASARHN